MTLGNNLITKIGYASIKKPSEEIRWQLDLLESYGCEIIYKDLAPLNNDVRPGIYEMFSSLSQTSIIYTPSFFNIFSTLESFTGVLDELKLTNSSLVIIKENITISQSNIGFYENIWSELIEFRKMSWSRMVSGNFTT